MIKIEEKDLLDLIHWSRRYCDGRATFASSSFNQLYEKIVRLNPEICQKDPFDYTLSNKGEFFPYAQDGMYNEKTGAYDARTRKPRKVSDE
jgi:hypothetical protein